MLTGSTRLVGLLGMPVAGSLSPRMQNAAFAALGLDWAYVPLEVAPERLEKAVTGLAALGFEGANVTIPHKVAVVDLCHDIEPFAARAGSVNTLVTHGGRVAGSSTDGLAVAEATESRGSRVLLLGAGGAARAVAAALAEAGAASITVAAREPGRARALCERVAVLAPDCELSTGAWPRSVEQASLLVNTTPLVDGLDVEPRRGQQVVDLAYRPDGRPTALVAAARAAGCARVVDGLDVLVRQGAASFERWTGVPAPIEIMRAALAR